MATPWKMNGWEPTHHPWKENDLNQTSMDFGAKCVTLHVVYFLEQWFHRANYELIPSPELNVFKGILGSPTSLTELTTIWLVLNFHLVEKDHFLWEKWSPASIYDSSLNWKVGGPKSMLFFCRLLRNATTWNVWRSFPTTHRPSTKTTKHFPSRFLAIQVAHLASPW